MLQVKKLGWVATSGAGALTPTARPGAKDAPASAGVDETSAGTPSAFPLGGFLGAFSGSFLATGADDSL